MTAIADSVVTFAEDVRAGLARAQKQLPPKYFYDALGSSLFDAICRLPWYGITRAEFRLLDDRAASIVDGLDGGTIVELGCGNGDKLWRLADALHQTGGSADIHLVDVSAQALEGTRVRLEPLGFNVVTHQATYEDGLRTIHRRPRNAAPLLVLFLGSNIGNFDPADAQSFLTAIRARLRPGDRLLLGADLVKPERDLVVAYDDPLGVTGAFNKNVLVRVNAELGGDFDLTAFVHRAVWNAAAQRVEMHLVSTRAQRVRIERAGLTVDFAEGESIWTESSYKYEPEQIDAMAKTVGFALTEQWIDGDARFALNVLIPEP